MGYYGDHIGICVRFWALDDCSFDDAVGRLYPDHIYEEVLTLFWTLSI